MVDNVLFKELNEVLKKWDKRTYKLYRRLRNLRIIYECGSAIFSKVQGDPYAPPSIIEVRIPKKCHELPRRYLTNKDYQEPLSDYISRNIYVITRKLRRRCGSGNSCYLGIPKPGPHILLRSSAETVGEELIIRFYVGLPARGRRILAKAAIELLSNKVNDVVNYVVESVNANYEMLERHIELYGDHEYLREWLHSNGYVAFIPNNAILPRESSISLKPMKNAKRFISPKTLEVKIRLPSGNVITGMAIPKGLIVITGGAYHGKTTLLNSIQEGIYNHVRGDGRELLVSLRTTVTVRAEDGRIISNVDISNFIDRLPDGTSTSNFSTLNASGSTSMAASIVEALEVSANPLLIDEDTSATNLLYKDEVMSKIIPEDPIRTLSNTVDDLLGNGVSIIIVLSSSSAFLKSSTKVIKMSNYVPSDISEYTRKVIKNYSEEGTLRRGFRPIKLRQFYGIQGLNKVKAVKRKLILYYENGLRQELDLSLNPRIVEDGQVRTAALIIKKLAKLSKPLLLKELVYDIDSKLLSTGFKAYTDIVSPDLTRIYGLDVAWILNRVYGASFNQVA